LKNRREPPFCFCNQGKYGKIIGKCLPQNRIFEKMHAYDIAAKVLVSCLLILELQTETYSAAHFKDRLSDIWMKTCNTVLNWENRPVGFSGNLDTLIITI
jgi:hypothetical protein